MVHGKSIAAVARVLVLGVFVVNINGFLSDFAVVSVLCQRILYEHLAPVLTGRYVRAIAGAGNRNSRGFCGGAVHVAKANHADFVVIL